MKLNAVAHAPHCTVLGCLPLSAARSRRGYVIFAVLIVIVVLSLVAYRFTDSMTAEYRASVRGNDNIQAKYAAISGLHYAAAMLSDLDAFYGELGGYPYDNPELFDQIEIPVSGAPVGENKRAYFSIRCAALSDFGGYEQRFGVVDEGGKLNLNAMIMFDPTGELLFRALLKIPGLSENEELVAAIVDWMDGDDEARAGGAESAYYSSLPNPYLAKNGPLNSLDELLLVKGMTRELLYGGDTNRNGILDDGETGADQGLSDFITIYGRELNVDAYGFNRVYINGDDLETMFNQLEQAVGTAMAAYVIASKVFTPRRGQTTSSSFTVETDDGMGGTIVMKTTTTTNTGGGNQRPSVAATTEQLIAAVQERIATTGTSGRRIRSVTDLINTSITLPRPRDAKKDDPDLVAYSPMVDTAVRNDLLALLLDRTTTRQAVEMVPRINVNTAPREVLMSMTTRTGDPILTDAEADAIVNNRANQDPLDLGTVTGAWLVTTDTVPVSKFRQMERYFTGSTMVYRIQSIGYLAGGGPVARMEAVIDINQGAPRFLYIRDLSELDHPRGFEPTPVNR